MAVPILFNFLQLEEIGAAPSLFNFRQLAEIGTALVTINETKIKTRAEWSPPKADPPLAENASGGLATACEAAGSRLFSGGKNLNHSLAFLERWQSG